MADKVSGSSTGGDNSNKTISVPVFHLYHKLLPGNIQFFSVKYACWICSEYLGVGSCWIITCIYLLYTVHCGIKISVHFGSKVKICLF